MKKLLTPKQVEFKKSGAGEQLTADVKRLFIRTRPNSTIDYLFIYQWEGKRAKISIKGTTLKEVRSIANKYNDWLDIGVKNDAGVFVKTNPKLKLIADEKLKQSEIESQKLKIEMALSEETKALEQEAMRVKVNTLYERWEKLDLINRKDKGKEVRRMFEKDVLPLLGNMAVEDVKKTDVATVLDNLLARGVNRTAKLTLALMRQMFRFAQDRDIIENDPTSSIRKAKIGGKDVVRDRHLNEAEIKALNAQLPTAKLSISTECAVWIILSTCCRIGELCKAKWEHLDLEAGVWKIPAENSKNGKPHTIYLSEYAKVQFKTLSTLNASKIWMFPNTDNTNHVCEKSITKQLGDRQLADDRKPMTGRSKYSTALKLSDGKWTPHDLRRTGATLMGNLGIRPDVIEKCLNHIEQNKMIKTYQHQTLTAEQQHAWKMLGERLELLTTNDADNVVVGTFGKVA